MIEDRLFVRDIGDKEALVWLEQETRVLPTLSSRTSAHSLALGLAHR